MSELVAFRREVRTPFGLLGTKENSLTFALGFMLKLSPELLQQVLIKIGVKWIRKSSFKDLTIKLQDNHEEGITDIELIIPNKLHVIIEAKIGHDIPSQQQCEKYLPRLVAPKKKLVILQNVQFQHKITQYINNNAQFDGILTGLYWADILENAIKLLSFHKVDQIEGYWLRNFINYIKEEYQLEAYTCEVWIVPTSKNELWPGGLSFYDTHTIPNSSTGKRIYYRGDNDKANWRPLYMAFRSRGFDEVYRVIDIQYDRNPILDVPEFINMQDPWPNEPHTIWYLGEPIKLPHKIETGGVVGSAHVTCDFDLLLTCKNLAEIRQKMKARK